MQRLRFLRARDDRLGAAVVGNEGDLCGSELDVDRVDDRTGLQDAVVHHYPAPAVLHPYRDHVARIDSYAAQVTRKYIGQPFRFLECQRSISGNHQGLAAESLGARRQHAP
jgi:hypothetical protein